MLHVLVSDAGQVLDPNVPLLHADDLGVLHGDGLFETMLMRDGLVRNLERHIDRLATSTAPAGLPPIDIAHVAELIEIAATEWRRRFDGEGALRVVYTRGREGGDRPTLYVTVSAVPSRVAEVRRDGIRAVTLPTAYRPGLAAEAPWLLAGVKSLSYAANVAALRHVQGLGVDDAIFVADDGSVLEGPRSSVVAVIEGVLVTPLRDDGILPGTTQAELFAQARTRGIPVDERRLHVDELFSATEVWLLSSITVAARVHRLNGQDLPNQRKVIGVAAMLGVPPMS